MPKGESPPLLFLLEQKGGVTANFTSKLKQILEDTAEAKEQVTNSHSVNFRDEVTQIPHIDTAPHPAERCPGAGRFVMSRSSVFAAW